MKAIVCHAPEDLRLDSFETDALGAHPPVLCECS